MKTFIEENPPKITFTIQNGPVREFGENGCQVDDVIAWAKGFIESLNVGPYACRENAIAITELDEALLWLMQRRLAREKRGVEGTSAP